MRRDTRFPDWILTIVEKRFIGFSFIHEDSFEDNLPVTVGHDVFTGGGTLLDGITVGHGAVIGAGAVVTKNVDPYAIIGGVLAKTLRYRFPEELRGQLLESAWWDKDLALLSQLVADWEKPEVFLAKLKALQTK